MRNMTEIPTSRDCLFEKNRKFFEQHSSPRTPWRIQLIRNSKITGTRTETVDIYIQLCIAPKETHFYLLIVAEEMVQIWTNYQCWPFSLITANKQRWCLTTLMHHDNIMLTQSISFCCYLEVAVVAIFWIGNRSSRPRVMLPEVAQNLSHVARNFSNVARKKSQVARRNRY